MAKVSSSTRSKEEIKQEIAATVSNTQIDAIKYLIEHSEEFTQHWRRGWSNKDVLQQNANTRAPYRNINQLILHTQAHARAAMTDEPIDPRWLTKNQLEEKGFQLKPDAKASMISFYTNSMEVAKKDENGKIMKDQDGKVIKETIHTKPLLRYFYVFNAQDIQGIPEFTFPNYTPQQLNDAEKLAFAKAESLIQNWAEANNIIIKEVPNKEAFFATQTQADNKKYIINLPRREQFEDLNAFYAVALHELAHSTKIDEKLRTHQALNKEFGSKDYAREELIAELSSLYLAQELGIDTNTSDLNKRSFFYIGEWYKEGKLNDDDLRIAVKDAQKVSNALLKYNPEITLEDVLKAEAIKEQNEKADRELEQKIEQQEASFPSIQSLISSILKEEITLPNDDELEIKNQSLLDNFRRHFSQSESQDIVNWALENADFPTPKAPMAEAYAILQEIGKRAEVEPSLLATMQELEKNAMENGEKALEIGKQIREDVTHYLSITGNNIKGPVKALYFNALHSPDFFPRDIPEIVKNYVEAVKEHVLKQEIDESLKDTYLFELDRRIEPLTQSLSEKNNALYFKQHFKDYGFNEKAEAFKMLVDKSVLDHAGELNIARLKELAQGQLSNVHSSSKLTAEERKENALQSIVILPDEKGVSFANILPNAHNVVSFDYAPENGEKTHLEAVILAVKRDQNKPDNDKLIVFDIKSGEQQTYPVNDIHNIVHIDGRYTKLEDWEAKIPANEKPIIVPFEAAKYLLADARERLDMATELDMKYKGKSFAEITFHHFLKEGTRNYGLRGKETIINDSDLNNVSTLRVTGAARLLPEAINELWEKHAKDSQVIAEKERYVVNGKRLLNQADSALVFADGSALMQNGNKYRVLESKEVDLFDLAKKVNEEKTFFLNENGQKTSINNKYGHAVTRHVVSASELLEIQNTIKQAAVIENEYERAPLEKLYTDEQIKAARSTMLSEAELLKQMYVDRMPPLGEAQSMLEQERSRLAMEMSPDTTTAKWVIRDEKNPPLLFNDGSYLLLKDGKLESYYNEDYYAREQKAMEQEKSYKALKSAWGVVGLKEMEIRYARERSDLEAAEKHTGELPEVIAEQRKLDPDYDRLCFQLEQQAKLKEQKELEKQKEEETKKQRELLREQVIAQPVSMAQQVIQATYGLMKQPDGELLKNGEVIDISDVEVIKSLGIKTDEALLQQYNPKSELVNVNTSIEELAIDEDKERLKGLSFFHVFKDDSIIVTDVDNTKYAILSAADVRLTREMRSYQMNNEKREYEVVNFDINSLERALYKAEIKEVSLDNAKSLGFKEPTAEIKHTEQAVKPTATQDTITASSTVEVAQKVAATTQAKPDTQEGKNMEKPETHEEKQEYHAYLLLQFKDGEYQPIVMVDKPERVRDFMQVLHPDIDVEAGKNSRTLRLNGITLPLDRVMTDYKSLVIGEENLREVAEQEKAFREECKAMKSGLSQAEIVLESITDGKKPTPEQAFALLKSVDDDFKTAREPHFELDDKGKEKPVILFGDGSKLDLSGETMIADANLESRIDLLAKRAVSELSRKINEEFKDWKEYAMSLYKENKDVLELHKAPQFKR